MPADSQAAYQGLSGQVWGSHVYYESTKAANKQHGVLRRPVTLSRDNGPNWRAEDLQGQCLAGAGSPAGPKVNLSPPAPASAAEAAGRISR